MNKIEHIGLIPDGIRRWAEINKVSLNSAYDLAISKLVTILTKLYEMKIPKISVYVLSIHNLKRPPSELSPVFKAGSKLLKDLLPSLCQRNNVKIHIAGLVEYLPRDLSFEIANIMKNCKSKSKNVLNLCIAYDPFEEINQAFQQRKINKKDEILESLWVNDMLDLVIRTGGANTLSNFLPLQTAYSRLVFLDKLFNDIEMKDILKEIEIYGNLDLKWGN